MLRKSAFPVVVLLFLVCLPSWAKKSKVWITGTVSYRQRIALPPDAIVNVQLQDVSLQNAPAKVVAEVKIPSKGKQVPIPFRIRYDPTSIDPAHTYAVRATISEGGHLRFTSTTLYPVITRGAPTEVTIMVEQVTAEQTPSPSAKLEGTHWKLIELSGAPVVVDPNAKEVNLVLDASGKRLSGSGGCNGLLGSYTLGPDSLRFKRVGSTMMACPEPVMKQEQAFVEVLNATTTYRIVGRTLELRDGEKVLARLESQPAE